MTEVELKAREQQAANAKNVGVVLSIVELILLFVLKKFLFSLQTMILILQFIV